MLEVTSRIVGTGMREYGTFLSWQDTANYAAAIGDENPLYYDDLAGPPLAHPMVVNAVNWPVYRHLEDYALEPQFYRPEAFLRIVHYTEHVRFHRPLQADTQVVLRGAFAAYQPRPSGVYHVVRFQAADGAGRPLYDEYVGGIFRDVSCPDGGRGAEELPRVPRCPAREGEAPLWEVEQRIGPLDPYLYDGCTRISFPIHTSPRFAREVGLPGILYQGSATLARAVTCLIDREAGR